VPPQPQQNPLGDFDPATSDIDWIVVTDTDLEERLVHDLQMLHTQFAESPSPWATKIEAVYVPYAALCAHPPTPRTYPQLEKGTPLGHMVLEPGWVFQCWTLRERGIVVAGPHPHLLAAPIKAQDIAAAVVAIAGEWLTLARHDPSWLVWMQEYHTFVLQTLCRLLYSLAIGEVASPWYILVTLKIPFCFLKKGGMSWKLLSCLCNSASSMVSFSAVS
jgi:hypothetical protein